MQRLADITKLCLTATLALGLVACNDDDDDQNAGTEETGEPLSLRIVHINDHHSHLEEDDIAFDINGIETEFPMGGFSRVITKINELAGETDNVLKLHAGDAITGTLYYTLFNGEADAALMNQVCFDAFALGNHEFDAGDAGLKTFLDFLGGGSCDTPVLAANVVPEVGVSPLTPSSPTDYIQPYVVKEVDGQRIGIIGIDIAQKTKVSSNPDETTEFLDETETAQRYIDELAADGVNKIILLTHYQYDNDLAMVANLTGVDVVVGGDSHSLLGGGFADLGLSPAGEYPTVVEDADGSTVCVVQAWEYSNVVGELNVEFDAEGNVTSCAGTPHLLLGDQPTREVDDENVALEGAELQAAIDFVEGNPLLSFVTPDPTSEATIAGYSDQVDVLNQTVVGTVTEDLCLSRIPGDGRSSIPGCSELTAENGGHIQQLVAHGYREQIGGTDIVVQNAGGVRVDVEAGAYTIGDAYTLLPFANTMVALEMTGAEIKQVLEEGVSNFLDQGGSTGAFPYASGLRWHVDLTQPFGSRFSNHEVKRRGETTWSPLDDNATYTVVTNSFAAGGGDGYTTFKTVSDDGRALDLYLEYAQTWLDYVESVGTLSRLPVEEYSTQSFVPAP